MAGTRIFLVGFYGMGNLGDEAIRASIERAGAELGVEISHYAVRRDTARRVDKPRAVRLRGRGWRAYVRAAWNTDRLVIGGGGLFKDQGARAWQGYGILIELLATALLVRLRGRSVALIGIGVGPIYTKPGAWLINLVARLAGCRLVRDQGSAGALGRMGIRKVQVRADPAFSMRDSMNSLTESQNRQWPPRRMLISARPWYVMATDGAERWRTLVAAIAQMADEALEDGLEIQFACLDWPQDLSAAKVIVARMRHGEKATVPTVATNWWGLTNDLRRGDVLVAMRYHAIACAAMTQTPTFALAYEPKVLSLAEELGLPLIDVNDQTQVDSIPAATRAFREADSPVPGAAALDEATKQLSTSARRGLAEALTRQHGP